MQIRHAAFAALLIASPAAAVEDYDACIALIAVDAARAEAEADTWARFDGGWPARHCQATALAAMGAARQAARLLSDIAVEATELPNRVRANLFAEAGELFLSLDALTEAEQAVERALKLTPDGYAPLLLSASLGAERLEWRRVRTLLDDVIEAHGEGTEPLLLRATAKRRLGDMVGARSDALWAAELTPDLPDAWLELGLVETALGNRDGARQAFLKAITLDSEGPLAPVARRRLQELELAN